MNTTSPSTTGTNVQAPGPEPIIAATSRWLLWALWSLVLLVLSIICDEQQAHSVVYLAGIIEIALVAGAILPHLRWEPQMFGRMLWRRADLMAFASRHQKHRLGTGASLLHGFQVTLLLTILSLVFFETSFTGEHLVQAGYDLLRHHLSATSEDELPVVVIDTSRLGYEKQSGSSPGTDPVTNVTDILKFIQRVSQPDYADVRPRCIGIDLNFHDPDNTYLHNRDAELFEACSKLSGINTPPQGEAGQQETRASPDPSSGTRVFLGVSDCLFVAAQPGASRLVEPQYEDMAASIDLPTGDTSHLWARIYSDKPLDQKGHATYVGKPLKTMGQLLSEVALAAISHSQWQPTTELPQQTSAPRFTHLYGATRLVAETHSERLELPPIFGDAVLVNYDYLKAIEQNVWPLSEYLRSDKDNNDDKAFFKRFIKDKIVLLGDVEKASIQDGFVVPGSYKPHPGVMLHASLAATLIQAPLYELDPLASTCSDVGLAGVALLVLYFLARRHSHSPLAEGLASDSSRFDANPPGAEHQDQASKPVSHESIKHQPLKSVAINLIFILVALIPVVVSLSLATRHIFWPEALLVSFALLIHRPVESGLHMLTGLARVVDQALYETETKGED